MVKSVELDFTQHGFHSFDLQHCVELFRFHTHKICELVRIVKRLFLFDRTPNHCMEQNPAERPAVRMLVVLSMRSGVRAGSLMQTVQMLCHLGASLAHLVQPVSKIFFQRCV